LTREEVSEPVATSDSQRHLTFGDTYSSRHNSLNFLRLVMCLTVIVSHGITLGGFGDEWILGRTTVALPTLFGFFALSGFLLAGSAQRESVGRYLWQRFLRIMPGYWLCLIVTAFVIGALAWSHQRHLASCNIFSCYYYLPHDGPFGYLYHNWLLATNQVNIGPTPVGGPVPYYWNNSVWTLLPEVFCYLILACLAGLKLLRNRRVVVGLACAVWLLEVIIAGWGPANNLAYLFGPFAVTPSFLFGIIMLTPAFLAGTLLYLYRDQVRDSGWIALGCVAVFAAGVWLPFFGQEMSRFNHYLPGATSVMAPILAYPLLWLGIHLPAPFQKIGARNDYSYGVYIYGWPVQQLLGIWGVQRWGYVAFTLAGIAGAMACAVVSWHLVEKRALRLKKLDPRAALRLPPKGPTEPTGATVTPTELTHGVDAQSPSE
jgi:peptidoglycan/LPS O-acetylase OafA/YrhL